jgi:hypothetical protein
MNREQMIERVVTVMLTPYIEEDQTPHKFDYEIAKAILDAILPLITTVEELEALPVGTKLIDSIGGTWTTHEVFSHIKEHLPLTVVWRPS